MRIGYNGRFLSTKHITGVERVAQNLLNYLIKNDKKNEYVIFAEKKECLPKEIFLYQNVSFIECKILAGNRLKKHFWEQFQLPYLVKEYKCDILFNPANTCPVLSARNSILFLCDVSFLVNPSWFSLAFRHIYGFMVPIAARQSVKIITISEHSKKEIVRYLDVEASKIKVVYPASPYVFSDEFCLSSHDVLESLGVRKPYILFLGSQEPRKNLINLVKAYLKLKENKNFMHSLLITGTDNPNFSEIGLDSCIKSGKIHFLGYLEDYGAKVLYKEADLFVYPSLYEGFGLPPLEAMACGCPVVVSNTSSLPEVCGDAAYYVDPYSVNSISGGIMKVLCDEKLRQKLIYNGYERIKIFSWQRAAEDILNVFEEIAQ